MDPLLKDFQKDQEAVLPDFRIEEGWYVPKHVKFGTYYRRHAESLAHMLPFVGRRKVALQAGGHVGAYPVWLSKYFGHVYTIEPDPRMHVALTLNTLKHGNISPINAFLANKNDFDGAVTPFITIDTLNFRELDLLCLDIEGAEFSALCGALQTIHRCEPVILMEEIPDHHTGQDEWRGKYRASCNLLETLGYKMLTGETERCGPDRIWTR